MNLIYYSKDKNHATEALCQALFTVPELIKIIRDPEAGPLVRAAYSRFLSEVNYNVFYVDK